jgi:hypothetical protein
MIDGGQITGVLDWTNAHLGDKRADVAPARRAYCCSIWGTSPIRRYYIPRASRTYSHGAGDAATRGWPARLPTSPPGTPGQAPSCGTTSPTGIRTTRWCVYSAGPRSGRRLPAPRATSHKSQVARPVRRLGLNRIAAQLTSPASGWLGLSGDKTGRHNGHRRSASLHLGFAQTAVISITENYVGLEQVRGETT